MGPARNLPRSCVRTKQDECRDWLDWSGRVFWGRFVIVLMIWPPLRSVQECSPLICYCKEPTS